MAATAITNTVLTWNTSAAMPETAAVDATLGAYVTVTGKRMLIILENVNTTTAKNATIVKGNGIFAGVDYVKEIPATEVHAVVIETGKFKLVSGDNKGKILIKGASADIQVACIELP